MEELKKCPVCGNDHFTEALECPDHFLSGQMFQIVKCSQCQTLLTNPRPDEKSVLKYYKSNSYISHSNQSASFTDYIYKLVRNYTLDQKLKMIQRYSFKGHLLDYGCGTGHFLTRAKKDGWHVMGIEPDDTARKSIDPTIQPAVFPSLNNISSEQSFSVITLFHVLEHVHQLEDTFQNLVDRLNKNGVIFLALPNYQSADARHYKEYWAGYDVPRHLYHFNQRSVFQLSKKYGLNIVSTIPMKFDSYYVSMLSEKYLGNKATFTRGLLNGYRSNRKARKTKEYSSLIYVLTK